MPPPCVPGGKDDTCGSPSDVQRWKSCESGSRWEIASRGRFATLADFPLQYVARTEGYMHGAKVWDVSLVQGPVPVALCRTLVLRFATFAPV
jgi:hypothetical protein